MVLGTVIAVVWDNTGTVDIYTDEQLSKTINSIKVGYTVQEGGALVLGHRWSDIPRAYKGDRAYTHRMGALNIWDYTMDECSIIGAAASWNRGNVFYLTPETVDQTEAGFSDIEWTSGYLDTDSYGRSQSNINVIEELIR